MHQSNHSYQNSARGMPQIPIVPNIKKELFNDNSKQSLSKNTRDKSAKPSRKSKKRLNKEEEEAMIERLTGPSQTSYTVGLKDRESYRALSKNARNRNRDPTPIRGKS